MPLDESIRGAQKCVNSMTSVVAGICQSSALFNLWTIVHNLNAAGSLEHNGSSRLACPIRKRENRPLVEAPSNPLVANSESVRPES